MEEDIFSQNSKMQEIPSADIDIILRSWCYNAQRTDFYFITEDGSKKFHAHKLVLAMRSPILGDIFNEPNDLKCLTIEQGDENAVQNMIRFCYDDQILLNDLNDTLKTKALSDKYGVFMLSEICKEKCSSITVTSSNVFDVLQMSREFKNEEKEKKCLEFISQNLETELIVQNFMHLPFKTVLLILDRIKNVNSVSETKFFRLAIIWVAKNEPKNEDYKKSIMKKLKNLTEISVQDYIDIIEFYADSFFEENLIFTLVKKFHRAVTSEKEENKKHDEEKHRALRNYISQLEEIQHTLEKQEHHIEEMQRKLDKQKNDFEERKCTSEKQAKCIEDMQGKLKKYEKLVEEKKHKMDLQDKYIKEIQKKLDEQGMTINIRKSLSDEKERKMEVKLEKCEKLIEERKHKINLQEKQMEKIQQKLDQKEKLLEEVKNRADQQEKLIKDIQQQMNQQKQGFKNTQSSMECKEDSDDSLHDYLLRCMSYDLEPKNPTNQPTDDESNNSDESEDWNDKKAPGKNRKKNNKKWNIKSDDPYDLDDKEIPGKNRKKNNKKLMHKKFTYNREELLRLRNQPICNELPNGLRQFLRANKLLQLMQQSTNGRGAPNDMNEAPLRHPFYDGSSLYPATSASEFSPRSPPRNIKRLLASFDHFNLREKRSFF